MTEQTEAASQTALEASSSSSQQQVAKKAAGSPDNNNDRSLVNNNLADSLSESLSTGAAASSAAAAAAVGGETDDGRVATWLAKNRQFQQQQPPHPQAALSDEAAADDEADSGRPSSADEVASKQQHQAVDDDIVGDCDEDDLELESRPVLRSQMVRGASPVPGDENDVIHQFLIPNRLGGSMVGTRGRNISYIRAKSGASVWISRNFFDKKTQVVNVRGPVDCVKNALQVIRKRFPDLDVKPINTAVPIQRNPALQPTMCQLSLPVGATVDATVCAMCRGTTLFLQQPTHPSYHHLEKMDATIKRHYALPPSSPDAPPCLPRPVNPGAVCVAPFGDSWHRAIIADVFPEEDAVLMKYLDWGGYEKMPVGSLKQIRTEMMHLPFQAVEAHLAYVSPVLRQDGSDMERQLEELSRTIHQRFLNNRRLRLKCQVVYFNDVGQPCVYLYAREIAAGTADSQQPWRFVQEELVQAGLMQWFQMPHAPPQLPQSSATHQQQQQQQS